jgi:hypothetical protein
MPRKYNRVLREEAHKMFLGGLMCTQIANNLGIKRQGTIKKWAIAGGWEAELEQIAQEAAQRTHEALVEKKAEVHVFYSDTARALAQVVRYHLSRASEVEEVNPDTGRPMKRRVPLVSPQECSLLAQCLERAYEMERIGKGLEDGQAVDGGMILEIRHRSFQEQLGPIMDPVDVEFERDLVASAPPPSNGNGGNGGGNGNGGLPTSDRLRLPLPPSGDGNGGGGGPAP